MTLYCLSYKLTSFCSSLCSWQDKMIAEARKAVQIEKEALESQLRGNLVELANELRIDGV